MTPEPDALSRANALSTEALFSQTAARLRSTPAHAFAFRFLAGPELGADDVAAAADMLEANVKPYLEGSSMGWSRAEKEAQLRDASSRLILAYPAPAPDAPAPAPDARALAAFLCLRFEPEDLDDPDSPPVLYCYELQVAAAHRRRGLGRLFAAEAARLARARGMRKVVLTVAKANTPALRFYDAVGFGVDETSPDGADYSILSLAPR